MKKMSMVLLVFLLLILLAAAGAMAYLYSAGGNARVQAYLEKRIEQETRLKVRFVRFELSRGHLYFVATLGQEASLGFDGAFDLLHRRLNGRYLFRADHARYEKYMLRQARIAGHVNGTIENLKIDGNGTLLDAPAAFKLFVRDRQPQDIVVQLRRLPLDELLVLAGQPPIVHGELNSDILLPAIGREGSRGKVIARLEHARFDPAQIARHYHYTMPPDRTTLKGELHAQLDGPKVTFDGALLSDLITLKIQNGQANLHDRNVACDLTLDAAELAPATQNRLHGPMKLAGILRYDTIGMQIRAKSRSLGGLITVNYTKSVSAVLKDVSLSRLLHLLGQGDYARGKINGRLALTTPQARSGQYRLKVQDGRINSATLNQDFGTSLPPNVTFALNSQGRFDQGVLSAAAKLSSNLFSATLSKVRYTITGGKITSAYRLQIPNPLRLAGKSGKGVPVSAVGTLRYDGGIHVTGRTSGLGKRLDFDYAGTRLKVDARAVVLERLLASAGMPAYLSGLADARIDLKSFDPLEGTFQIRAPALTTHPEAVKKLLGKPLKTTLALTVSARAHRGVLQGRAQAKSPLATLSLPKLSFDTRNKQLASPFKLFVPELSRLEPLIEEKLRGPLETEGKIRIGKVTDIEGSTASLGGSVRYRYHGSRMEASMQGVVLPKLLHMINQPDLFLGTLDGTIQYESQSRTGKAHLQAEAFQIKPGRMTQAVQLILHKDLAQVIYDRTTVDARFRGDRIDYRFKAHGRRSDFVIKDGQLDTRAQTHKASFGLRIDNVDVIGTIKGPMKHPKISVLPGKMLRGKIKKKVIDKVVPGIKKEINKATGGIIKSIPKLF